MPENPAYPPIDGNGCQILGVVTGRFIGNIKISRSKLLFDRALTDGGARPPGTLAIGLYKNRDTCSRFV